MRTAVGCGLAVAVMALAGCSHSSAEESQVLPTLSAPATASPPPPSASPTQSAAPASSPSRSAVVVPAAARDATPQGAAAFARYFYGQITRGFQLRDPALVSDLSLETCKTCKLYVNSIAELRKQDERFGGGGFSFLYAVSPTSEVPGEARVDVKFDFAKAQVLDRSGRTVQTTAAVSGIEEQLALVRFDGMWRVRTIKRVVRS